MTSSRDISTGSLELSWLIFAIAFVVFAYFHQGGDWNSNARFAMVRALVEKGEFTIDSYLIYQRAKAGPSNELRRIQIRDAEFVADDQRNVLVWSDSQGRLVPINGTVDQRASGDVRFVELRTVAATADVAYYAGHFHPNKAPGTSFIAVPAYAFIFNFERIIGANPDEWWTLTINAWLTSVFSVGLLSAFGVVLLYRFAVSVSAGCALPSVTTAVTFAFGTMFLPYATALYEHNIVAVALLASVFFLYRVNMVAASEDAIVSTAKMTLRKQLFLAGLCAGYAAITNYIVVGVVIFLLLYLILTVRGQKAWCWFGLGLLGPFLLICAYNAACFGTPFTTNYRYQNPFFADGTNAFLGVFAWPRWSVLLMILFSPFRGLFFSSPALLVGLAGLVALFRDKNLRPEAWLLTAIVAFFILFNTSFNDWDGGWTVVPRYLGPAVPFLALPMVFGFVRFFKITSAVAAISAAIMLLITAVTVQAPIDINATAVLNKSLWRVSALTEYEVPIFLTTRPGPLMQADERQVLRYYDLELAGKGMDPDLRRAEMERLRHYIETLIAAAEPAPLDVIRSSENGNTTYSIAYSTLSTIASPVSVTSGGIYGGWVSDTFGLPGSVQARWNSFNVGEFFFPESRWSLLPLLLGCAALVWRLSSAPGIGSARSFGSTTD
jgi:hypothetical protein